MGGEEEERGKRQIHRKKKTKGNRRCRVKRLGDKYNAQDIRQGRKQEIEREKSHFLKKRCCCAWKIK